MKVFIELNAGSSHLWEVTNYDVQKNIDAIQRAITGKPLAFDFVLLIDTKSILEGIDTAADTNVTLSESALLQ